MVGVEGDGGRRQNLGQKLRQVKVVVEVEGIGNRPAAAPARWRRAAAAGELWCSGKWRNKKASSPSWCSSYSRGEVGPLAGPWQATGWLAAVWLVEPAARVGWRQCSEQGASRVAARRGPLVV
jgi:hypothetical protein